MNKFLCIHQNIYLFSVCWVVYGGLMYNILVCTFFYCIIARSRSKKKKKYLSIIWKWNYFSKELTIEVSNVTVFNSNAFSFHCTLSHVMLIQSCTHQPKKSIDTVIGHAKHKICITKHRNKKIQQNNKIKESLST